MHANRSESIALEGLEMTRAQLYIGGKWINATAGKVFESRNPSDGSLIATLQEATSPDLELAVAAANGVNKFLRQSTVEVRASWCEAVANKIEASAELLADAMAKEQGKPRNREAIWEVRAAAKGFRDAAGHVRHLNGETLPSSDPDKRVITRRSPRGTYVVITPWNFPLNIPTEYLAPALATGNSVIWIPAPTTSYIAVLFMQIIESAGIPAGVINLLTGYGHVIGDAAVGHKGVNAIGFTGSTRVGNLIAQRGAGKPMLLELGGNGPAVVFADADLQAAAQAICDGAFLNAGQTCSATELVFVERKAQKELAEKISVISKKQVLGNSLDEATTIGPLNNEGVAKKMEEHISDALKNGAELLLGGTRAPELGSELFFNPTLITNVSKDALVAKEETFGPIVPLVPFDSFDEVVSMCSAPQFGLSSAVWTKDAGVAFALAEQMRSGIVNINDSSTYWELHIPFGGGSGTMSGIGRVGGIHTLMEMTEIKTITFNINKF